MTRSSIAAVLIALLSTANVIGQTVTIPLDKIWAYDMPGTRKVQELDSVKQPTGGTSHPIVKGIIRSLSSRRREEKAAVGPAFVVLGSGKDALQNAHDVLANAAKTKAVFPPKSDLTLVFYTKLGGPYVHIRSVEHSGQVITVKYRFVAHNTREDTIHFALIPLGQLREGKYDIKVDQLRSVDTRGKPAEAIADPERFVCQDSSFSVER